MDAHEARMALMPLVTGTPGWTDDHVRFYSSELTELNDPVALAEACRAVLRSWTAPRRPPLAAIYEAYRPAPQLELTEATEPFVPVSRERVRQLLAEGLAAGRAERRSDPSTEARRQWWRAGAKGHYPGCDCKRCVAGLLAETGERDELDVHRILFDNGFPEPW
jgi:hypothetical protein